MSVFARLSLRRRRNFAADNGGAAAVEFAFVFPVFLAMVMTIFQFGWAQHKLSSIRFAMEKASRDLLLDNTLSEAALQTKVRGYLNGLADQSVTVTKASATTSGVTVVTLTGTYTTNIGVPYLATYPVHWSTTVTTPLP